jgi:hypothetical protein
MLLNKLPQITTIVARARYIFGVLRSKRHIVLFVHVLASKQAQKNKTKSHQNPDFLFHITIESLVVFCFWRLMVLFHPLKVSSHKTSLNYSIHLGFHPTKPKLENRQIVGAISKPVLN